MEPCVEVRRNTHCQMLVDVGIVLARAYGPDYARAFLEEMHIQQNVIDRVLSGSARRMMHLQSPLAHAGDQVASSS